MKEYEYKAEGIDVKSVDEYLKDAVGGEWECIHVSSTKGCKEALIVWRREVNKNKWGLGVSSYGRDKGLLGL